MNLSNLHIHEFYDETDTALANTFGGMNFLSVSSDSSINFQTVTIAEPSDDTKFLHEAAIIAHKDILWAAWYCCPEKELNGYTPIVACHSLDEGKSWSTPKTVVGDKSGKILYCPPVFAECGGKLYMLLNEMTAPDHIHSLDAYILDEEKFEFEFLWSKPIPFKLNTNPIRLSNGKLMLPGRVGELDGFPNTPAVLISDSGKVDAEWRVVKIAPNGDLPDGAKLFHPEITAIENQETLYVFCRNDYRRVPLAYISNDLGESWSGPFAHDIPYVSSKMYSGKLSDGRNYLVANIDDFIRRRLALYLTDQDDMKFNKKHILFDFHDPDLKGIERINYPAACEYKGKLYVIATKNYSEMVRGAVLYIIEV